MVTKGFRILALGIGLHVQLAGSAFSAPVCLGNCSIGTSVSVGSNGAGNGSLAITGGDVVTAPTTGFIGAFGPSSGIATVTGAGSRLLIGGLNSRIYAGHGLEA